jgi:2-oxoglutarate/2-oxoacid ferredoxin oxidoreductase subunit alpha
MKTETAEIPEPSAAAHGRNGQVFTEQIVEVISDSGEGAQKCGQSFGAIAARMGYGVWTVEIIPAEIQPPARSIAGASGNRIRFASGPVTNGGDEADLVVALNEQVLMGRVRAGELKPGCTILLENKWRTDPSPAIAADYLLRHAELLQAGYRVLEVPMETECLKLVKNAQRGKNMFVLGLLCGIYEFDLQMARDQIVFIFGKKSQAVIDSNIGLLEAGYSWAQGNLDLRVKIPATKATAPQMVINGNIAIGLGVVASGMKTCAMYPITPATSASHYLSEIFDQVGGFVHQAEDEIAACCFAIGASYAGTCAVTITSGPGYSLKQEAIGLAVMAEIPLVVVNVQRGGPSTGQPTKVEQGDLLATVFGSHGDAPKVVIAPASIEECFYSVITARKIAETFNLVVVVLTDASLATAQTPFTRPQFDPAWYAPPVDQSPVPPDAERYDWDPNTGLARRFIPGQPNGMHCLTGLAHDRKSRVAYDPKNNHEGLLHRSRKLITLQKTLITPAVYGDDEGDLLVVGWGSTKGAIEEAVRQVRTKERKIGALHLRFIQPMPPGVGDILRRYRKVLVVENNWCDPAGEDIDEDNRRYTNLAWLLRGRYLVDADCWSQVLGQPIKPGTIAQVIREKLS